MSFYFLLSIETGVISFLAWIIWIRTHSVSVLLGLIMMYYWSLFGAWSIVHDRIGGEAETSYGYLEEKLFPVFLDESYFATLILYACFIVLVEVSLLLFVRPISAIGHRLAPPVRVNHGVILGIGVCSGIASYLLVREYLQVADDLNVSGYLMTRGVLGTAIPYFTIHQILNRCALLSVAIGLAIVCSGSQARLFVGGGRLIAFVGYAVLSGSLLWLALMLGNKNELLLAGVVGTLLYEINARSKNIVAVTAVAIAGVGILWLIDMVRGLPLNNIMSAIVDLEFSQLINIVKIVTSNNEAYAAHFSLYGILALKIPLTYGESLVSGAASIVPRFLWPDRPPDIYFYYAGQVGATEGQGYTIHHAAGWYLNFGIPGIIIGALIWGAVWAKCFDSFRQASLQKAQFWKLLGLIAPSMFVASIPMLMRVGVEGYKGFLIEGLLLPTLILTLASGARNRSGYVPAIKYETAL